MKIIWSPKATDRVIEIGEYIAQDSLSRANKWIKAIFNEVKILKKFPQNGRKVPETKRNDIRQILFGNYRIIYKIDKNKLSILTIRHGKQILPLENIF